MGELTPMLKPVVKALSLRNFRSIPDQRLELGSPCFLVGKNGSGKSNVVDAFAFLSDAMVSPLQAVFDDHGGITSVRYRSKPPHRPRNLAMAIDLGLGDGEESARYAFEIRARESYGFSVAREQCSLGGKEGEWSWFDRTGTAFKTNVDGLSPQIDDMALCLPLVGGDSRFSPVFQTLSGFRVHSIEPGRLREMQDPDAGNRLKRDGSNSASVLREIRRRSPEEFARICEFLEAIVPSTMRVQEKKHGNKLSLEFLQRWGDESELKFEGFNMSDGTLRAIGLLAAVFQHPGPTLLVIEEPEATIHIGALPAIMDLIRHAARKMQVVVTTHSAEVLDTDWITADHLRVVEWSQGATRVGDLSEGTKAAIRDHLMGAGDLLRANALEAGPLFESSELIQSAPLFDQLG